LVGVWLSVGSSRQRGKRKGEKHQNKPTARDNQINESSGQSVEFSEYTSREWWSLVVMDRGQLWEQKGKEEIREVSGVECVSFFVFPKGLRGRHLRFGELPWMDGGFLASDLHQERKGTVPQSGGQG